MDQYQPTGKITWGRSLIAVTCSLAGQRVLVIARGDDLSIFARTGLVRRFQLDRTRRYQPNGLSPGRPKRKTGPCHECLSGSGVTIAGTR